MSVEDGVIITVAVILGGLLLWFSIKHWMLVLVFLIVAAVTAIPILAFFVLVYLFTGWWML